MPETGSRSSGRLIFELLDETLDLNRTESYHLSIQVCLDGFLFSVLDPSTSRYLGIKRYQFDRVKDPGYQYDEIRAILDMDPFLQRTYEGVSCIFNDKRSTLLPAAIFEREQLKLYFEFNHLLNDLDELHYLNLNQIDAYLVFPVYSEIAALLMKRWLNTVFFQQAVPLIDSVMNASSEGIRLAGVNFNEDHFDIAVAENRKLLYHNNFSYRSDEDLLYFILFVFDKLALDQESCPLLISGEIDKFGERPQLLRKYFGKPVFQSPPSGLLYPASFHKLQEHTLFNLLSIYNIRK